MTAGTVPEGAGGSTTTAEDTGGAGGGLAGRNAWDFATVLAVLVFLGLVTLLVVRNAPTTISAALPNTHHPFADA
jgi:hypothetical protein